MAYEIKNIPIREIKPANYNPRDINPSALKGLIESIRKFGMPQPLVINKKTNVLVSGHQRLKAAQALNFDTVPVVYVDLSVPEEKALNVTLNNQKISGHFTHELGALLDEIRLDLGDDFFRDIKLDEIEVPPLPEEENEKQNEKADHIPEVAQNELGVQLGDIFQLGEHRLMCGDSTDKATVEKLMNGEKAELCFTSPPYADQREYRGGKELSTEHLAMFINASTKFCNYFAVNLGISRKDGQINSYWDDYIKAAQKDDLKLLSWNVWHRDRQGSIGLLTAMFIIAHEWVFVFGKKPKQLNPTVENKSAGQIRKVADRQKDGSIKYREDAVSINELGSMGTVLDLPAHLSRAEDIDHPAMFPVALPEEYIKAMTKKNQIIYEPFTGSGSTLIACEKTNRKCYGMELDPHYCSVIIKRWEKFTGKKANKI